jgi:hypothetical protein
MSRLKIARVRAIAAFYSAVIHSHDR